MDFSNWSAGNIITVLVGLGAIVLAWDRVKGAITSGPLAKQRMREDIDGLLDANLTTRIVALETATNQAVNTLQKILEVSNNTNSNVSVAKDESNHQHGELKDFVHSEIQRVEKNVSDGRGEIFKKIDKVNDRIDLAFKHEKED